MFFNVCLMHCKIYEEHICIFIKLILKNMNGGITDAGNYKLVFIAITVSKHFEWYF